MITDPDFINQGGETNVVISKAGQTIELVSTANSALTDLGITGQALYSFLKEQWKNDPTLIPFPFPMISITPEQFEFVNGWSPLDDSSRNLLRNCGWRELDAGGNRQREYMGIVTLGTIGAGNTAYYEFAAVGTKIDFDFAGNVNQGIKTFDIATDDNTPDSINLYIRTRGQHFDKSSSIGIGLSGTNYIANRFPLTEIVDQKASAADADMTTDPIYTQMRIEFSATPINKTINNTTTQFNVIVHASGGTVEEVYDFIQYSLRQNSDIGTHANSTEETGALHAALAAFIGDTLKTSQGVFINNHDLNDTNSIIYVDNAGVEHRNAFIASGNLQFNDNLTTDSDAVYRMFFTTGFGSAAAILVNDNDAAPISGTISNNSTISFSYDYDNNVQQGNTVDGAVVPQDADVTIVAIGLDNAQYVRATATITRSVNQNISLVAPLERNYSA